MIVRARIVYKIGRLWKDTYVFEPSFSDIYCTSLFYYFIFLLYFMVTLQASYWPWNEDIVRCLPLRQITVCLKGANKKRVEA